MPPPALTSFLARQCLNVEECMFVFVFVCVQQDLRMCAFMQAQQLYTVHLVHPVQNPKPWGQEAFEWAWCPDENIEQTHDHACNQHIQ